MLMLHLILVLTALLLLECIGAMAEQGNAGE